MASLIRSWPGPQGSGATSLSTTADLPAKEVHSCPATARLCFGLTSEDERQLLHLLLAGPHRARKKP